MADVDVPPRPRRSSGAWEINLVQPSRDTARTDRCTRLFMIWSGVVGVVVVLYLFVGYRWASVAAAALLAAACWFTWYYFGAAPAPAPAQGQQQAAAAAVDGGGLKEEEIEAIPAFEYRRGGGGAGAREQCAVCIAAVKEGDTVRRLPACGHAFHAPCVDSWLRAHATCPVCRADVVVKVVDVAGEAEDEAAAPPPV
uniref:RING-type E3 ubiquitin transferase n=1 Tax=Leersia perrieri TaxID=77586 RepID=A0A0D9XYX4_9ORYZ